ncbi:hypothetical protein TGARI_370420 [Toxoplasma gondii ARI]|uniref:Uncharacterized protein n=1 Tax=Toxoplasma gondii ARI TaxID=1074872 RepID=A0A139XVJ9_TOXGO|nr:hypothetical protein TGARI_370420 [Toxoplasma gondii ARI]
MSTGCMCRLSERCEVETSTRFWISGPVEGRRGALRRSCVATGRLSDARNCSTRFSRPLDSHAGDLRELVVRPRKGVAVNFRRRFSLHAPPSARPLHWVDGAASHGDVLLKVKSHFAKRARVRGKTASAARLSDAPAPTEETHEERRSDNAGERT